MSVVPQMPASNIRSWRILRSCSICPQKWRSCVHRWLQLHDMFVYTQWTSFLLACKFKWSMKNSFAALVKVPTFFLLPVRAKGRNSVENLGRNWMLQIAGLQIFKWSFAWLKCIMCPHFVPNILNWSLSRATIQVTFLQLHIMNMPCDVLWQLYNKVKSRLFDLLPFSIFVLSRFENFTHESLFRFKINVWTLLRATLWLWLQFLIRKHSNFHWKSFLIREKWIEIFCETWQWELLI